MPTFDWQLIVVILTMAAAVTYLARRSMTTFRSSRHGAAPSNDFGSCGSCGSCHAGEKASNNAMPGFVPLEDLTTNKSHASSPSAPDRM